MSEPSGTTSHYGWALWHLQEADAATVRGPDGAMYHLAAAQVHATLWQGVVAGIPIGVDPGGPTVWDEGVTTSPREPSTE